MATLALACRRLHAPAPQILSLQLYRALRPLVGPVRAWRLAFAWRAMA